jgi:hypothetical protein
MYMSSALSLQPVVSSTSASLLQWWCGRKRSGRRRWIPEVPAMPAASAPLPVAPATPPSCKAGAGEIREEHERQGNIWPWQRDAEAAPFAWAEAAVHVVVVWWSICLEFQARVPWGKNCLGMEKRLEKKEIRKREGGACGADDAWQCGADALLLSRSHDANDPTAARPEDAARAILRGISSVSL